MADAAVMWVEFLAGQTRSPDAELHAAMAADEELRRDLLEDERMHGLLAGLGHSVRSAEEFNRAFSGWLAAENTADVFADGVLARLEAEGPPTHVRPRGTGDRPGARRVGMKQVLIRRGLPPPRRPVRAAARRRLWWGTALAASILVAFSIVLRDQWGRVRLPQSEAPVIASIQQAVGDVSLVRRRQARGAVRVGQALVDGDTVRTGGGVSTVLVEYPDRSTLVLEAETTVSLGTPGAPHSSATRRIQLERGSLVADISSLGQGTWLSTRHAEIEVLATLFRVQVAAESTRIDVQRGEVKVRGWAEEASAALRAGHYAVVGARTVVSRALPPPDRQQEEAREGLQVLYTFGEGAGCTVRDRSGTGRPLHLRIADPGAVAWLKGGGLDVRRPTSIASAEPATELIEACRTSGELTIVAWIRPRAVAQSGPARIISVAPDFHERNFTLAMDTGPWPWKNAYVVRLLGSLGPDVPGNPMSGAGTVRTELTHVVFCRGAADDIRLYVDGRNEHAGWCGFRDGQKRFSPLVKQRLPNRSHEWNPDLRLALANEIVGNRPWLGTFYRVAVYSRALSEEEVARDYRAFRPARSATR